jgi:hypothetical protein
MKLVEQVELCPCGDDVLLLTGPSMDLDGRVHVLC